MKKILVVLVCLLTSIGTMSIKAQDGNLSKGQWNHGLAIGAQHIANQLSIGKKAPNENYTLEDLRVLYGANGEWIKVYDKLKTHENETGDIDKLVSVIKDNAANIKSISYICNVTRNDVQKYNASHTGNEVQSTAAAAATPASTTSTTSSGTNVVAASDTTKTAAANGEKEGHGGHGFLYFLSLLGLALGGLGTFLAMQARKENQIIMRDANDDIKNLQKQIDKMRATLKGQEEAHRVAVRRENKIEQKNTNDNLAQAKKIDFDAKPADKNAIKPAEKKVEPKKEEVKKVEPKKEEVKKEEPKKEEPKKEEPRTVLGEPRILFMAKPDENDDFSRSSSSYEPGNSIFELTTMDGKSGSFTVIGKSEAQKLALLMPGDTLTRACSGNNIQSIAGKTKIVTDRAGRAQLQNGKWHIVVKAIIHYA